MNFAEQILERSPASKPALVALDSDGNREVWHFGELIARSAGLSGALAARGVRRGDALMTLVANRPEWVLAMLTCFRLGQFYQSTPGSVEPCRCRAAVIADRAVRRRIFS